MCSVDKCLLRNSLYPSWHQILLLGTVSEIGRNQVLGVHGLIIYPTMQFNCKSEAGKNDIGLSPLTMDVFTLLIDLLGMGKLHRELPLIYSFPQS